MTYSYMMLFTGYVLIHLMIYSIINYYTKEV